MFRKRKQQYNENMVEQRFDAMVQLIKDLPRADYNRLKDAMDLTWSAYQKVRNVKTIEEKENGDITESESLLENLK